MPVYTYTALNERGKSIKGIISADSARHGLNKLRQLHFYLTRLTEIEKADTQERGRGLWGLFLLSHIRQQDLTLMTRQFATLIAAHLTIVESLTALIEEANNPTLKKTLIQVRESVNEGDSLAAALGKHPQVFSSLFINMVGAGAVCGALPLMLPRLADFNERQLDTRKKITLQMYYPIFMLAIGSLVLFALLTYVVPMVTTIFADMKQTLPWPTVVLISVSDFLQAFWWLLGLAVFAIAVALQRYRSTERGTRFFDTWAIRLPLFGPLTLKMAMSRFTRALGILLQGGIPHLHALDIASAMLNNTVLAKAIDMAKERIREGSDIAAALRDSGYIPPMVSHMISIGEQSGQLEKMLLRVADTYDNEVQTSVEGLMSLIEPVITVVMAVGVFVILLAILLPISEINTLVR